MAEKKKMSVAEILAAARKLDNKSGDVAPQAPPSTPEPQPSEVVAEPEAAAPAPLPSSPSPSAKPPGGKLSTAEILAAARAGKAAAKPAAPQPAAKPATPKPAAKPVAAKAAVDHVPKVGQRDTASILAAARKAHKPGPMSKAEAALATKVPPTRPVPAAKAKIEVPPMPAKPASVQKKLAKAAAAEETRRGFLSLALGSFLGVGFTSLAAASAAWTLGIARFMFPNVLTEPPSAFKVGFPADFPPGAVTDKFKAQFGVWVVNGEYNGQPQIYALRTVCTHLGCTPNWLEAEQKFKCPCHGSGFYKDGINFEGPAPRPLERYAIRIAEDGQLEIDKSKKFQEELGQWNDPSSYVPV
jgi:cytochrome b6-f complex iron-sulfur subunit